MIYTATARDIPGLIKLWENCFTTDSSFINNFFKSGFSHSHTFIIKVNEIVVSSVSILPSHTKIFYEGSLRKVVGGYLYAVATLPEHQKKGYSTMLTSFAINYCTEKGYAFIAVYPASNSLYNHYIKNGFNKELYCNSVMIEFPGNDYLPSMNSFTINSNEGLFIALEKNFNRQTILFDISFADFILKDIQNKQGTLIKLPSQNLYLIEPSLDEECTFNIIGSVSPKEFLINSSIFAPFLKQNKIKYYFPTNKTSESNSDFDFYKDVTIKRRGLLKVLDSRLEDSLQNLFLLYPIE